ncbi:diguanylate cyclase domain-containing protein [Thiorhodospira sibirica]
MTLSQGVTPHQTTDRLDDLLKRADAALYRAKEQGQDRLELG